MFILASICWIFRGRSTGSVVEIWLLTLLCKQTLVSPHFVTGIKSKHYMNGACVPYFPIPVWRIIPSVLLLLCVFELCFAAFFCTQNWSSFHFPSCWSWFCLHCLTVASLICGSSIEQCLVYRTYAPCFVDNVPWRHWMFCSFIVYSTFVSFVIFLFWTRQAAVFMELMAAIISGRITPGAACLQFFCQWHCCTSKI